MQFNPKLNQDDSAPTPLNVVLVLTATINPGSMIDTKRNDPELRLRDYSDALKRWLTNSHFTKIVFCENSASDLSQLKCLTEECASPDKQIEFLSFREIEFPEHKGKAYGEIGIIAHVLRESELVRSATHITKVTGRLFVSNTAKLTERYGKRSETHVFCNVGRNMTTAECRIFGGQKAFFENYLLAARELCDEKHVYANGYSVGHYALAVSEWVK